MACHSGLLRTWDERGTDATAEIREAAAFPTPRGLASQGSKKAQQLGANQILRELDPAALNTVLGLCKSKSLFIFHYRICFAEQSPSDPLLAPSGWFRHRVLGSTAGRSSGASALLPFAALFSQRLLMSGGCCSLLLLQSLSCGLLLLLCVTLHVSTAALHLIKDPAAAGRARVRVLPLHSPPPQTPAWPSSTYPCPAHSRGCAPPPQDRPSP